jgi:hypothetical protein
MGSILGPFPTTPSLADFPPRQSLRPKVAFRHHVSKSSGSRSQELKTSLRRSTNASTSEPSPSTERKMPFARKKRCLTILMPCQTSAGGTSYEFWSQILNLVCIESLPSGSSDRFPPFPDLFCRPSFPRLTARSGRRAIIQSFLSLSGAPICPCRDFNSTVDD